MITRIVTRILTGIAVVASATTALAQPTDLAAIASQLPPLSRAEGRVAIPIDGKPSWRGVREGIEVRANEGRLDVAYEISAGQPAGAALVFGKGSLGGIRALRIRVKADRSMQLIPTMSTAEGAAFAFPALSLTKGKMIEIELPVSELTYFAPQSKTDEPDNFSPAEAVMLTLLDISGFMGGSGAATLTIESIEGVL